jgi:hypothetical protein
VASLSVFPFPLSVLSRYFNFLFVPQGPDYFLGDPNTPLPGPYREPIRFRYFAHTPDCPNKISPNDLVDSYDRPLNVRACPHCHGRLRKGESAPNTWHTPLHWDVATQEVFGPPITKQPTEPPSFTKHYFEAPGKLPVANFVRKTTVEQDPLYPERKDKGPYVVGDYEEWVVPELKLWSTDQESHPLDQNYFEPARMQGAVRNNFCIFRVLDVEANITFISPSDSNNDEIAESYITEKDENGRRLTKPLRVLKIEPENVFALREEEEGFAADYHALFNDEDRNETVSHHRIEPWKLMPYVFENGGSVSRVWWCSIGKTKVTTDTARLREEYESDNRPLARDLCFCPTWCSVRRTSAR